MSHMIFERAAEILKADILNIEDISTQPLSLRDITDSKVINILLEVIKVFLDKLCRGFGPNNKKLLSVAQDIITLQP